MLNKKKNTLKKTHRKNATKKSQLKIQPKNTTKKRGDIKEWVKGEEEPTEKIICPEFLPESFSFLFMKLYRNVYQIKTMCRIQLCFFSFICSKLWPVDCLFMLISLRQFF